MIDVNNIIKVYSRALEHSFVDNDGDNYDYYFCINALIYTVEYYDDFGKIKRKDFLSPMNIDTNFLVFGKICYDELECVDEFGIDKFSKIISEDDDYRRIYLEYERKEANNKIVYSSDYFDCFRLVRFENGEFGYLDEKDNILPYRFDFATDFGVNGLAIVAKCGKVNFIDKNFEVFNAIEDKKSFYDFVDDSSSLDKVKIDDGLVGYEGVTNFTSGDNPFCAVGYSSDSFSRLFNYNKVNYLMDLDGDIIPISQYKKYGSDFVFDSGISKLMVLDNCIFDCYNGIYLENGIFLTFYDVVKLANEKGLNEKIFSSKFLSELSKIRSIHICTNGDLFVYTCDFFDFLNNYNADVNYDLLSSDYRIVRVRACDGIIIDGNYFDYFVYLEKLFSVGFMDVLKKDDKKYVKKII